MGTMDILITLPFAIMSPSVENLTLSSPFSASTNIAGPLDRAMLFSNSTFVSDTNAPSSKLLEMAPPCCSFDVSGATGIEK